MGRSLWLALLIVGCRKVPEPIAGPSSTAASPSVVLSPAAPVSPLSPPSSPSVPPNVDVAPPSPAPSARCVRPTPEVAPPPAKPAARCPKQERPASPMQRAKVAFPDAGGLEVDVELARSTAEVTRGLMFRTSLGEKDGMLFRLDGRREHVFWMENTCLPLDMLFVDEDGTVVGILENVPVLNRDMRTVGCPSLYVLEVNAGFCRKRGIKAGQRLVLPTEIKAI